MTGTERRSMLKLPAVPAKAPVRIENGIVTPPVLAISSERNFDFPPLKRAPQTHGVHVATLHMRAYFAYHVDLFSSFALHAAANLNMPTSGIARLPKTKELVTVLQSPFVHKKSMENFTRYTHKRTVKVYDTDIDVLDIWLRYLKRNSIGGVGIKCYIHEYEQFGFGSEKLGPVMELAQSNSAELAKKQTEKIARILSGPTYTGPQPDQPIEKVEEAVDETVEAAEAAPAEAKAAEAAEAPKEEATPAPEAEAKEVKSEAEPTPKQ